MEKHGSATALLTVAITTMLAQVAFGQARECGGIDIDFSAPCGEIKPIHGVGQPPMVGGPRNFFMMHYLKEAGIPFSRLHDVGGKFGENVWVDIPNIFRNFDADETDPSSYDFTFTDRLITSLVENGVEPYYRLGVTIENYADIKAYRCLPPKDYDKWARICEHVIRHYTEGWADGFRYKITYWEIWNEPEGHYDPKQNGMWQGTFEEFTTFYKVAATHLKKCFPALKIGGYAACSMHAGVEPPPRNREWREIERREVYWIECFTNFLASVKAADAPLDFFSFHSYWQPADMDMQARFCREKLDQYGFTKTEMSLNEWLPHPYHERVGTAPQASEIAAELITLQKGPCANAMIYDGRCGMGSYSPLFDPLTYRPRKAYYAFKAFNELYRLKTEVTVRGNTRQLRVLAAGSPSDGRVLIANDSADMARYALSLHGMKVKKCFLTDFTHTYEQVALPDELPGFSFVLLEVGP